MTKPRAGGGSLAGQFALVASLVVLATSSCTTSIPTPSPTPVPIYGAECAAFAPDPSDEFFTPLDVSYNDPTPLDWPTATGWKVQSSRLGTFASAAHPYGEWADQRRSAMATKAVAAGTM